MSKIAVYPGTFDPITKGHEDIIRRAAPIFDEVIVTLAINSAKDPLFSVEERIEMIEDSIADLPNVSTANFTGLMVEFAAKAGAIAIIRGLRAVSDFEFEFQMALMNRKQNRKLDTVYLMPDERYTYLSSSIIREVSKHGGDISEFVSDHVLKMITDKHRQST